MRLAPGSRLGPYEVVAQIGAGGMGEVYRARDPRLNREVAIKVLPADRVSDEDRRRRFIQEAHAASALNHPHIITIHEIESANGIDFIVMEYMRGKSLDALIPRHGMRLGEVLRVAIPVADALAAAHARGIIHRDLKPANVMVGTDGAVKVLDFGLAKLSGSDDAAHDQLTHAAVGGLSAPGTIAGTAAYMSPEQATGGPVDARSDIFSFGALLYEMVTGVRAFVGTSIADTLAAVLRAQPKPPIEVVPAVPSDLQKVILRCLRKDPERRIQHMGDVKLALQEVKEDSESATPAAVAAAPRNRRGLLMAAVGGLVVLAAIAGSRWWPGDRTNAPPARVTPLTTLRGHESWPTFSPDGNQVAFQWSGESEDNSDIYVKFVDSSALRRLTSGPQAETAPSWSPDARQIAYVQLTSPDDSTGHIHILSALDGSDLKLSDLLVSAPLAWSSDGRFLAAQHVPATSAPSASGIYLIPIGGGHPRRMLLPKAATEDRMPAFSHDGRRLAYASCTGFRCELSVIDLNNDLVPVGTPKRLVKVLNWRLTSLAWTRDDRSLIYNQYLDTFVSYLWRVSVDGGGAPERIELAGQSATSPATVSETNRLAFARRLYDMDVYRFEAGGPARAVLTSTFGETEPRWSPDGRRLAFCSARSGDRNEIWVAAADGTAAQQLTHGPGSSQGSPSWSPDGRSIAFDSLGQDLQWHIWIIDADGGTPRQLTTQAGDQHVPSWSQDGRWIYYSADEGGPIDIWRVPTKGGPPQRITQGGSGRFASETMSGQSVVYQPKDADSPLLVMPLSGGSPRQLVACVKRTAFGVGRHGIYYVPCVAAADPPLHVIDPETGRDRHLGTLEQFEPSHDAPALGLSISPDGMSVLYLRHMSDSADLMLIENFR